MRMEPHPNRYDAGCRCDSCRILHNTKMRDFYRKRKADKGFYHAAEHICEQCGASFQAGKSARFCSKSCARFNQAEREWGPARGRNVQRRRRSGLAKAAKAAKGTAGKKCWTTGQCRNCAEWFSTRLPRAIACSATCSASLEKERIATARRIQRASTEYKLRPEVREAKARHRTTRRARKQGAFVAPVYRLKIYERDAFICHLCGEPADRNAIGDAQDAVPTIDHIIPLDTHNGSHEPANVHTAHFLCNSKKCNVLWSPSEQLIRSKGVCRCPGRSLSGQTNVDAAISPKAT